MIIFLTVYLISAFVTWKSFSTLYSKGGYWDDSEPSMMDLFFTLIPVINTIVAVIFVGSPVFKNIDKVFA